MEMPCWCPPTWWMETNRNIPFRVLLQKHEYIPQGTQRLLSNTFSNTLTV